MINQSITVGDVIQIVPCIPGIKPGFGGKLALVEEVKGWGVIAFVDTFEGRAYVRLTWEAFARIGAALFLPEDLLSEEGQP